MTTSDNSKPKLSVPKSLVSLARQLFPDLVFLGFRLLELVSRVLRHILNPPIPYEVLDYDVTLDLRDEAGKRAYYTKRKKVRLLQDHIRAIDDHAWGDGNPVA